MSSATATNNTSAAYGALLLRVALGVMWIAHALLKSLVFTLPGTAKYFQSVGFLGFLASPVFVAELAGGIALVLGIYARQIALLLIPVMVCSASVHMRNGWVHASPGGGWEYPVFLVITWVSVWLIGDGASVLCRSSRFSARVA
ncbi:DoxX family protein [Burkholderia sp. BCC1988]|uniref:DoxX family protein n=1 Tax=Burkholderia sp. BCC1988 TaxID=2817443 RepID=UPI002AB23426|nr:DoxX family protein [Burkholderia sp. BCC1988]